MIYNFVKGDNKLVLKFLQKLNGKSSQPEDETEVQEIIPEEKRDWKKYHLH